MKDDIVIKIENLSKKFTRSIKRSMLYGTADISKSMLGIKPNTSVLRKGEFWSLKNINFEIRRGETFGLIGANGSGKSTLLRLINGIFPPDVGRITIKGKIGALIAVGAGFHPHMTGRENIILNGTILGMSKEEIAEKMNNIISFADIGDFLDAPVSTYSSGMTVRLGFAIAINAEPDILLIDEILAVGDAKFQRKCLDKIRQLSASGTTIILVSHSMQNIEGMCDNAILIHHGEQIAYGKPQDLVPTYEVLLRTGEVAFLEGSNSSQNDVAKAPGILKQVKKYADFGTDDILVDKFELKNKEGIPTSELNSDEPFSMEVDISSSANLKDCKLWVSFIYMYDYVKDFENLVALGTRQEIDVPSGKSKVTLKFDHLQLTTGEYKIAFHIFDKTFTNPYEQGHYGYFKVSKNIPTQMNAGRGTPLCWTNPNLNITKLK